MLAFIPWVLLFYIKGQQFVTSMSQRALSWLPGYTSICLLLELDVFAALPFKEIPTVRFLLRHLWLFFLSPHPRWTLNGPFTTSLSAFCQLFYSWFYYSKKKSLLLINWSAPTSGAIFVFFKISNCLFSFIFHRFLFI